ncbi:hypothetical protein DSO57_1027967 [Entomophthora muscae]|uniref:Uncharacterized protein n=1 Tax=Entomophthora muscae TaxID=34485 RepID=A0ACC2UAP1_9FUNG|nr:hypothetical protein DSO57_1027967 [Entomophthora muscae]
MMKRLLCLFMILFATGQDVKREDIYKMSLEGITDFIIGLNELAMSNTDFIHKHTANYSSELQKDIRAGKHRENVHYYFLNNLERALQVKKPLAIPYWNWTIYADKPQLDPIFSHTLFGRESDETGCLGGNFAAFFAYETECVKRRAPSPYADSIPLIREFMDRKSYTEAKPVLRTITNSVQTKFASYDSRTKFPRDPLHYLLISFELKLLYDWQTLHKVDIEDPKFDREFRFRNKGFYAN